MADVTTLKNNSRTLLDRNSLGNMGLFMFPRVPSVFAFAMGSHQGQNKMGRLLVNPLINGLMADRAPRVFEGQSSGDKLWGPSEAKTFFDIPSDKFVLKSLALMRFAVASVGSFLSFVSQVVAGINGRGVSPKLPEESAGRSL